MVPNNQFYLYLEERALLAVICCVIGYMVMRFIVPPKHHKTLSPKITCVRYTQRSPLQMDLQRALYSYRHSVIS